MNTTTVRVSGVTPVSTVEQDGETILHSSPVRMCGEERAACGLMVSKGFSATAGAVKYGLAGA